MTDSWLYNEAFTGRAWAIARCPFCLQDDHLALYCPKSLTASGSGGFQTCQPHGSQPLHGNLPPPWQPQLAAAGPPSSQRAPQGKRSAAISMMEDANKTSAFAKNATPPMHGWSASTIMMHTVCSGATPHTKPHTLDSQGRQPLVHVVSVHSETMQPLGTIAKQDVVLC